MKISIERSVYWLLLGLAFTVPISSFISVRLLFLALLISLINDRWNNLLKASWDLIIFLAILLVGMFYTVRFDIGIKVLETNFSFLALPIVVFRIRNMDKGKVNQIFYSFILGLALASFICLLSATLSFSKSDDVQAFFFYQLTDVLNLHPTYLAYYLIFAITFSLYSLYDQKSVTGSVSLVFTIGFFFFMLMLTGGTTAFISLLFVISFFILKFFLNKNTKEQRLTFVLVFIMMILMFVISSVNQSSRETVLNDSWDRFNLWKSAISANPNILVGVGTGDYKVVLNDFYRSHGMDEFADQSLNSHNQFIQILFTNGVFGLISVIIMILRPLYLSFKNNDQMGILMIFPFLLYGMTEVFLGRYQGVVFFVLLHQVFISHYIFSINSRQVNTVSG